MQIAFHVVSNVFYYTNENFTSSTSVVVECEVYNRFLKWGNSAKNRVRLI